jgi:recombination protein RecR
VSVYTESVQKLIDQLKKLPGIGEKTAERLAFHILKSPKDEAMELAFAVRDVKKNIRHCSICFNLAEGEQCPVCIDAKRNSGLLCVVEYPRDLISIEETGEYRGVYHVLLGTLSPVDDVKPEDIRIAELVERVSKGDFKEVILFTNATAEGDFTAHYIKRSLEKLPVKVTRMARGIPAGSEIEFVSKGVLADALSGRTDFSAEEADG